MQVQQVQQVLSLCKALGLIPHTKNTYIKIFKKKEQTWHLLTRLLRQHVHILPDLCRVRTIISVRHFCSTSLSRHLYYANVQLCLTTLDRKQSLKRLSQNFEVRATEQWKITGFMTLAWWC
jgi:hypothetical protein